MTMGMTMGHEHNSHLDMRIAAAVFCTSTSRTHCCLVMEASLNTQLKEVSGTLRGVREQIDAHQRTRRLLYFKSSRERARMLAWSFAFHVGLIVWVLRGDPDLAAQLAAQCSSSQRPQDASCSSEQIAERGSALSEECKHRLLNPVSSRDKRALAEARKLLAELSLYRWVRDQNDEKGLAPSKGALWRQWSEQSATLEFMNCLESSAVEEKSVRNRNQWMQRWASRWRVEQGRFKQGARLPLEVLRAKARAV